MNVVKDKKQGNYTVVPNQYLRDNSLSLKAKGLMTLIISLPESWDFSVRGLAVICRECRDTVRSALVELEKAGYLRRAPVRKGGRFDGWRYEVFVQPEEAAQEETRREDTGGEAPRKAPAQTPLENPNNTPLGTPAADIPVTKKSPAVAPSTVVPPQLTPYQEKKDQKPPQVPQGGGRARAGEPRYCPELFRQFWENYPRHEDRQGAVKAWDALRPDRELFHTLTAALDRQRGSDAWQRGIGIPYAMRWLGRRRWEDEPMEAPKEPRRGWDAGYIPQNIQRVW